MMAGCADGKDAACALDDRPDEAVERAFRIAMLLLPSICLRF